MVHVSMSCNPAFHTTGAHYINADTTAFMQLIMSDLFKDFPKLRADHSRMAAAQCRSTGAAIRGLALQNKRPPIEEMIKNNVFFDTCVYHLPGVELLTKVVPVDNILFASEMIGAVQIIDPNTGHYFDDTKRYVDRVSWLSAADKKKIFEDNERVYPGVAKRLAKGAWRRSHSAASGERGISVQRFARSGQSAPRRRRRKQCLPDAALLSGVGGVGRRIRSRVSALRTDYPDRTIKIIVPGSPGGPTDVMARLISQRLQQTLGQSVVVENRAGGGGIGRRQGGRHRGARRLHAAVLQHQHHDDHSGGGETAGV